MRDSPVKDGYRVYVLLCTTFESIILMEYSKMISVSGLTGLFELVSSKKDGAIVKSLEEGNTRFVSSRLHQFSHLESIEIYTTGDNVNLLDIFKAMAAHARPLPDIKDNKALAAYFTEVFPSMDLERVYTSDMKKMVKWFSQLKAKGVELVLSTPAAADEAAAAS